jgi:hypothetical protein
MSFSDLVYFLRGANIFVHVWSCLICLLLGLIVFLLKKGNPTHFRLGKWYLFFAWTSMVTALVAIGGLLFFKSNFFSYLTVLQVYQLEYSLTPVVLIGLNLLNGRSAITRLRNNSETIGATSIWLNSIGLLLCLFITVYLYMNGFTGLGFSSAQMVAAHAALYFVTFYLLKISNSNKRSAWLYHHTINVTTSFMLLFRAILGGPSAEYLVKYISYPTQHIIIYLTILASALIQTYIFIHFLRKAKPAIAV